MMPEYATFMYSIGMLDDKQRQYFQSMSDKAVAYIKQKNFGAAFQVCSCI